MSHSASTGICWGCRSTPTSPRTSPAATVTRCSGGRVYLRWDDGPHASFLVLDQQLTRPRENGPLRLFDHGVHHFSFWVDDLPAMVERMRAAGVDVVVEPAATDTKLYGEAPGGKILTVLVKDPDGNWVQLDQRLEAA